jgi:hypothetical protein
MDFSLFIAVGLRDHPSGTSSVPGTVLYLKNNRTSEPSVDLNASLRSYVLTASSFKNHACSLDDSSQKSLYSQYRKSPGSSYNNFRFILNRRNEHLLYLPPIISHNDRFLITKICAKNPRLFHRNARASHSS